MSNPTGKQDKTPVWQQNVFLAGPVFGAETVLFHTYRACHCIFFTILIGP